MRIVIQDKVSRKFVEGPVQASHLNSTYVNGSVENVIEKGADVLPANPSDNVVNEIDRPYDGNERYD